MSNTGIELEAAEQYILAKLNAVPGLATLAPAGFFSERVQSAPLGTYILWSFNGAPADVMSEEGIRILSMPVFLIRAIGVTSDFSTLQPVVEAMDAALHRAGIMTFPGYTVRQCIRERPYSRVEHFINIERRQLGGYYRFYIQPF